MKLVTDRGWAWTPAQWELLLSLGPGLGAFEPGARGGGILGTTLLTPYPEGQAISGVLVGTWAERRGVATALVSNILDIGTHDVSVLYATGMGEPLYAKLGFHPVGEAVQHGGVFTGSATGVTRAATSADLPALIALDREVCGFSRDELWARSAYALRVAEFASGLGLIGTRVVGDRLAIGPLIAPTAADACAMISDVAAGAGPVRMDVIGQEVADFVCANGFENYGGCALMIRGATAPPGDRSRYFAPASWALG
ncbi:GNAT family N-acetyltransferase [Lentzea sp. NPDC006480]|uniref:GNAT family N-acetyltransferase n=1 Tax=Lentzea sp. NPDC006480 TaxID=3157176 RepID=UPI0033A63C0A